jgi:hypothetical protein
VDRRRGQETVKPGDEGKYIDKNRILSYVYGGDTNLLK